ncbi:hypothetical protein VNO77_16360 [Canavalia gladiata]|uniref:Piriformospora indica-insensitive protein 2 n=1 Tax=Canavalia gladiata TaxID=3824 RepID=A0AAN9M113_CANGL
MALLWWILILFFSLSHQQPLSEQEALYQLLHSLNPSIPWRTLFPDHFCLSAPHGVVCDYPSQHIVELNFGYVSDETPNPPCSPNATFNPLLFSSFPFLRKLFFYKCFNQTLTLTLTFPFPSLPPTLQELVFIHNPSFLPPLGTLLQNLTSLRRLVLIGNGFHGEIPPQLGDFIALEEVTLSGNNLGGEVPHSLGLLKKLKVLDLSGNRFEGCVSESLGNLTQLLKLDMSFNQFGCRIPESFRRLRSLEFLDLSFNRFANFGVPLFLREIPSLKEVYVSGNFLSGVIPEIWENLGGIEKLGFSDMGLVGNIPASMGVYLKNLSYLGLDNNRLDGPVPPEFGLLEFADEINLENNNLSGRVPLLTTKMGQKLKVAGNTGLCGVENKIIRCGSGQLKPCNKTDVPDAVLFGGASQSMCSLILRFFLFLILFVFAGF